jgi:hypothetical protein
MNEHRTLSSATDLEVADRLMSLLLDVEDLSGLPCEWAQDDLPVCSDPTDLDTCNPCSARFLFAEVNKRAAENGYR